MEKIKDWFVTYHVRAGKAVKNFPSAKKGDVYNFRYPAGKIQHNLSALQQIKLCEWDSGDLMQYTGEKWVRADSY